VLLSTEVMARSTDAIKPVGALLDVEEIDANTFRSIWLWKPGTARAVFGGHMLGLALVRRCHC
jgi:acyl-CoA thioesterase